MSSTLWGQVTHSLTHLIGGEEVQKEIRNEKQVQEVIHEPEAEALELKC
jgi:hypothetical protein